MRSDKKRVVFESAPLILTSIISTFTTSPYTTIFSNMLYHTILTLTHPTHANAKKARIMEEIVTVAEAVFTEGMSIPEDKGEFEQEQEMWTVQWDHRLVRGGALWIN